LPICSGEHLANLSFREFAKPDNWLAAFDHLCQWRIEQYVILNCPKSQCDQVHGSCRANVPSNC